MIKTSRGAFLVAHCSCGRARRSLRRQATRRRAGCRRQTSGAAATCHTCAAPTSCGAATGAEREPPPCGTRSAPSDSRTRGAQCRQLGPGAPLWPPIGSSAAPQIGATCATLAAPLISSAILRAARRNIRDTNMRAPTARRRRARLTWSAVSARPFTLASSCTRMRAGQSNAAHLRRTRSSSHCSRSERSLCASWCARRRCAATVRVARSQLARAAPCNGPPVSGAQLCVRREWRAWRQQPARAVSRRTRKSAAPQHNLWRRKSAAHRPRTRPARQGRTART